MSYDSEPQIQLEKKKWAYTPSPKKATNYFKKRGRGYTKARFTKTWRNRRNRKNKLAKRQRRQRARRQ